MEPSSPARASASHAASPRRFAVLAAYCASSFLCAGAWNTLSPIFAVAQARFQVPAWAVTLVALSTFLTYIPGSLLALFVTERHGLRATLLAGAAAQTGMCLLKWSGVALCPSPHGAYALLLAGQLLGGLGQPLVLNVVARLTQDWCVARRCARRQEALCVRSLYAAPPHRFPPHERDVATVVGYQASNAGAMVFNALPAWVVRKPEDLSSLFLAQLCAWVPVLLATARWMHTDRPDMPPSAAAALQWARREAHKASLPTGTHAGAAALASLAADLRALCAHRNFVLLTVVFSLVAGMSWALPTLEGPLIEACGYSPRVAGGAGAALLAAGVVACAALAPMLRRQPGYLPLQRALVLASASTAALLLASNRPLAAPQLLAAWAAFGAAQGPLGPVTLEHAAEMTFPMSADSSSAALFIASNLCSFAQASTLQPLLARPVSARCARTATPAAALVMACMLGGCLAVFAMKPEQTRAAAEGEGDRAAADDGADSLSASPPGSDDVISGGADEELDAPLLTHAQQRTRGGHK